MNTLSVAPASNQIYVNNRDALLRRSHFCGTFLLAAALLWTALPGTVACEAMPAGRPVASAASIIGNDARLNGAPMATGATLFPGDVIGLGGSSTAELRFGNSLVFAAALTELVIESDGVSLRNGRLQVRASGADSFAVSGPFFRVNMPASGGGPRSAEIRLGGLRARVSAVTGAADLTAIGNAAPYRLQAGETATLDASGADAFPGQDAASPAAGQLTRLVPQVQIDRASQHIVAAVSDRVYWNDDLRSGPTGRAHITLIDGSQLNLGSDSSLRILQHDAQAQQTSLDLLVGRMRGRITKLTRPGSKFEIHTPTGVAGLVGTDFSLLVTDDYTELMVFEGSVSFAALNGQAVTVGAGNTLRILKSGTFQGPTPSTPQEVQTAENLTDVGGAAAASSGPAAGAATRPLIPVVITLTGAAAAVGIGVWQATRPSVSTTIP